MSAISGLWRFEQDGEVEPDCARMLRAQEMYGPHGCGDWSGGEVALGRCLGRVLPEDAYDRQPLKGLTAPVILVADVRLDNREELARQLQLSPELAARLCDAAIALAAFERWGEDCVTRLVGDFALAIWNFQRRSLVLARDPLGQRPLHFHRGKNFFAFASMAKGLHALADVPYEPDEESIAETLLALSTGAKTYFRGIERVMPGHIVTVTRDRIASRRYWEPRARPLILKRRQDYSEALRDHIDVAVKCRLRGVSVVGADLSGGLDSSAVASTAARYLAPQGGKVIAFTAVPREGYDGPAPRNRFIDESEHAAATAAMYSNMEHILIRGDGRLPLDIAEKSFLAFEEPIFNLCNAAWGEKLLDAARGRNLSVVLNGGFGNFSLSYDGMELLPELFSRGRWIRLFKEARALVSQKRLRWRGIAAKTLGPWCPPALWVKINSAVLGAAFSPTIHTAINPALLAKFDLEARARQQGLDLVYRPKRSSTAFRSWGIGAADPGASIKGVYGRWKIDSRDPTSDIRLVQFCLSVPTDEYLRGGITRALAREALSDRLPKVVLKETRRGLQAADWHERLTADRNRIAAEIERFRSCAPVSKALDLPRLQKMVEDWPKSGWERDEVVRSYRIALTRAVSTGYFVRRITGSNA